jgi:hypothetical protein
LAPAHLQQYAFKMYGACVRDQWPSCTSVPVSRVKAVISGANFSERVFPMAKGYASWETDEVGRPPPPASSANKILELETDFHTPFLLFFGVASVAIHNPLMGAEIHGFDWSSWFLKHTIQYHTILLPRGSIYQQIRLVVLGVPPPPPSALAQGLSTRDSWREPLKL